MPIYEFYCADCHTLLSFLSRRPSAKRPRCPRCGRLRLERRVSAFAVSRGRPESAGGEGPAGADETRMESVMAEMAQDAERIDENDPRQMAGFMRRFFDRSGMPIGPGVEEAMSRMEAGEDPDKIEAELGDVLEGEQDSMIEADPPGASRPSRKLRPPSVDKTLYEM